MKKRVIRKRAKVEPEFIDLAREMGALKLKAILDLANANRNRMAIIERHRHTIDRLRPLVKNDPMAIDRLKTDLRGLNYQTFDVVHHGDRRFLRGITDQVIMQKIDETIVGYSQHSKRGLLTVDKRFYETEPYEIYLNADQFVVGQVDGTKFMPQADPQTCYQHPHIYAEKHNDDDHPLDYFTNICWSGFAELVTGAAEDVDIVAMFRYLRFFIERWAAGEEFGYCNDLSFLRYTGKSTIEKFELEDWKNVYSD